MRVSAVALTRPPMTTMASGRWISAPGPEASKNGERPSAAIDAVSTTGRKRRRAPSMTASLNGRVLLQTTSLMYEISTTPFSTAMPIKAMKPTEAGTEMNWPLAHSAMTPPIVANGTLQKTSAAWRTEPKVRYSRRKIVPSAIGTTIASRAAARYWFSNWPPQTGV